MKALDALRSAIGDDAVRTGDAIETRRMTDWSGADPVRPVALVLPRSTEQVSQVLACCYAHDLPVVPQGGLTGLAGGAIPSPEAIALSLERMDRIEAVDPASGTITVEAGVTLARVQEAAAEHGLQFGVDFGARDGCHVGGAVATNAGGHGVLQFGMMREQVLGLEVVLADGTVLPMLRPMPKNNTGYDLKQWFIGAEGTLGVVTRAVLRLRPASTARVTARVALATYDDALTLLRRLEARFPGALAAFELMWRDFVETSMGWRGLREPFTDVHPLVALVEVTGDDEATLIEALEAALADAMEAGLARDAAIAQSHAQAREFWRLREATADFPLRMKPPINFDVSVPIADIGRFADACRAAIGARWSDHGSLFFGHIGDGNLHVTTDAQAIGGEIEALEKIVYDAVATFGGSISAEHGIGVHKKAWLGASRTPAELAAMRAIKRALDPKNLMNPGKVLDV